MKKDPYADREAKRYKKPIASREYIADHLKKVAKPLTRAQLEDQLGLHSSNEKEALRRRLKAMQRDGQLIRTRRGRYGLPSKMNLIPGRVHGHADGFGFVIPESGGSDYYLSPREMRKVFHGDKVLVSEIGVDYRGRKEGSIVEVLERATTEIVGRFLQDGHLGRVIPDNKRITHDILIAPEDQLDAIDEQIVIVAVTEQPSMRQQARGKIVKVVGDHMAPGMEIDIAMHSHGIPATWPESVLKQAEKIKTSLSEKSIKQRKDIRDLPLVTIDGEDARDFDDAVYCEPKKSGGWRLLVAIADVSYYVEPGTALDKEAKVRGNSVYFPGSVVPMLPEKLSNNLCSINPNVDRFCMVCEMQVSAEGKLTRSQFYEGVMQSKARLTYNKVADMLYQNNQKLQKQYQDVLPHLQNLDALYRVLFKARQNRGAIDFDTLETKIIFGEQRKIQSIVPAARNDAHRIIEECMLLANLSTAKFFKKHKIVGVYRNHIPPDDEKITGLREFLHELGLSLNGGSEPQPKHYSELLAQVHDRPDAHLIQTVMLRSLSQATYNAVNEGHFGLAFDRYTHFTSPIRRYPDLIVHRIIKSVLKHEKLSKLDQSTLEKIAEHCSMTERRADEATRDVVTWLKCEYMLDKVGEKFEGVVSAVTNFGLFVELDNIYVEGLVHITGLPADYYNYDQTHHRLVGERTAQTYRLGDRLKVQVARVDLDERKIDFELIQKRAKKRNVRKK